MSVTPPFNTLAFLPEKLRDQELYPKIAEMMNYIIDNAQAELEDVKYKYAGPDVVREEVVKEIVNELGFAYITGIMDTITNFQFNILLEFVGLINLLKGSKEGLELILKLLGFDSIISEWWEQTPQGVPYTFQLIVIMNTSYVQNPSATLEKVRAFCREYVFPTLSVIDFRYSLAFASKNVNMAGYTRARYAGTVVARL